MEIFTARDGEWQRSPRPCPHIGPGVPTAAPRGDWRAPGQDGGGWRAAGGSGRRVEDLFVKSSYSLQSGHQVEVVCTDVTDRIRRSRAGLQAAAVPKGMPQLTPPAVAAVPFVLARRDSFLFSVAK
ncbi:unnamed protein product, partial [Prorocentrum cordatum]